MSSREIVISQCLTILHVLRKIKKDTTATVKPSRATVSTVSGQSAYYESIKSSRLNYIINSNKIAQAVIVVFSLKEKLKREFHEALLQRKMTEVSPRTTYKAITSEFIPKMKELSEENKKLVINELSTKLCTYEDFCNIFDSIKFTTFDTLKMKNDLSVNKLESLITEVTQIVKPINDGLRYVTMRLKDFRDDAVMRVAGRHFHETIRELLDIHVFKVIDIMEIRVSKLFEFLLADIDNLSTAAKSFKKIKLRDVKISSAHNTEDWIGMTFRELSPLINEELKETVNGIDYVNRRFLLVQNLSMILS